MSRPREWIKAKKMPAILHLVHCRGQMVANAEIGYGVLGGDCWVLRDSQARRSSPTLQAWAKQPAGMKGASPEKASPMVPRPPE